MKSSLRRLLSEKDTHILTILLQRRLQAVESEKRTTCTFPLQLLLTCLVSADIPFLVLPFRPFSRHLIFFAPMSASGSVSPPAILSQNLTDILLILRRSHLPGKESRKRMPTTSTPHILPSL